MVFQPVRGMRDLLPEDMRMRNFVAEKMRGVLESYGYGELKTPVTEHYETLAARSGRSIEDQIYEFRDKAGRHLGLRFDMTVPSARVAATLGTSVQHPIKFYYIDRNWRYEEPQAGRYRELWHVGAELFGSDKPVSDAEVISCLTDCYNSVGLADYKIVIGHRRTIEDFARTFVDTDERAVDVVRAIDKKGKIPIEKINEELVSAGVRKEDVDKVWSVTNYSGDLENSLDEAERHLPSVEGVQKGLHELREISKYLKKFDIYDRCQLDLGLARGFDYYTGIIFESVLTSDLGIGSIGAGGRYDKLVGIYGNADTPATGFAIGLDRTVMAVERLNLVDKNKLSLRPDFYVAYVDAQSEGSAIELATTMRRNGYRAGLDLMGRNLRRQIETAAKLRSKNLVVIGPTEIEEGTVKVRDMESRAERTLPLADFLAELRRPDSL
ncbi:MAG TPA: histidine--tRNA ligase [Candidatus Wunengus californicus]|uniref:histidine--tRNA ligase n=1 Tax=Candidatus Wunengus californicus TaxID=3367619 RepID=UPI0040271023